MKKLLSVLCACFIFNQPVLANESFSSEKHSYSLETVISGLDHPWAVEFLPDGRILVTELPGKLRIIENGKLLPEPVSGLPEIRATGQGGLLDVALDPEFESNQIIYISYAGQGIGGIGTEVAKARLVNNALVDLKTIFVLSPKSDNGRHFGSRLLFADDGTLFITTGDRGDRSRPQNLDDHAGSLIRINKDGSIPEDNPFIGKENVKPEIYTYGNRNIQGIAIHPDTRDIWSVEHGPQGGDELNLMKPGLNYGWPVITYGKNYVIGTSIGEGTEKEGMEQPVHYWVPSIAISGMLFYQGDVFPEWKGNAFVSSLRYGELARLEMKDNKVVKEERLIEGAVNRIREVKEGPDGFLYIITDERDGKLIRIKPAD